MTAKEIVEQLRGLGSESTRKVLLNHGAPEPVFGAKIGDMKKIAKQVKMHHRLALELYDTGIYDAMYLAGMIADDTKMTKRDLNHWLARASGGLLESSTIPWVAVGSPHGRELALEWIDAGTEKAAIAGWTTLAGLVAVTPDAELNMAEHRRLLARVEKSIQKQPDAVRYAMNAYVIAVAIYVVPLGELAVHAAQKIGRVEVDTGNTACQVPYAPEYIEKARKRGMIGKKRKSAKC